MSINPLNFSFHRLFHRLAQDNDSAVHGRVNGAVRHQNLINGIVQTKSALCSGLIWIGITLALVASAIDPAQAQQRPVDGDEIAQHGNWQVVCKPPPPGSKKKVCALVQSVTAEDRNNVGLTVYFQRFSNGTRVLRVFAPLGILLPPGLGLKIDGKDVGNAPFFRCHTFACYAQVVVKDDLAKKLATGKTAIFVIFQTEEAGIGIPISLAGFSQGLAALK